MNVMWVISDTLRRDHLACYGDKIIHTPLTDVKVLAEALDDPY